MRHTFEPYQEEGLQYLHSRYQAGYDGGLLLMQMRLGKSSVALRFVRELRDRGLPCRTLILAPLKAIPDWITEYETEMEAGQPALLIGNPKRKNETLATEPALLISPYKSAQKYDLLRTEQWDVIILDELYLMARASSMRTDYFLTNHVSNPTFTLGLTGSIRGERDVDVVPQAICVCGSFGGYTRVWEYLEQRTTLSLYGKPILNPGEKENIDKWLVDNAFIMTRKAADVGGGKEYGKLWCEMPAPLRAQYNEELKKKGMERFNALWTLCSGMIPSQTEKLEYYHKAERLHDFLTEEYPTGSVVVFGRFVAELRDTCKFLKSKGITADYLYGESSTEKQIKVRSAFAAGDIRVLFLQEDAYKMGINASKADVFIYMTNSTSGDARIQSEDRGIHRSKRHNVYILDLVCRHGLDSLWADAVREKDANSQELMSRCLNQTKAVETWES